MDIVFDGETFKDVVSETIVNNVGSDQKSGPFPYPPLPRSSPMGAICNKRSGKTHAIHDISWPLGEADIKVDGAVRMVKLHGSGAVMGNTDLKDAYTSVPVRPADWHYLVTTWPGADGAWNIMWIMCYLLFYM
jgi:hypothetical protein